MELLLTADMVSAGRALAMGVLNAVTAPGDLLEAAHDDVRDQREEEEHEQHPGDALQRPHYRLEDLERPSVGVQRESRPGVGGRIDVFLEGRDPHAAAYPHHVDREDDVAVPRDAKLFLNEARKNLPQRTIEQARDDDGDHRRNAESDGEKREKHVGFLVGRRRRTNANLLYR